MRQLRSSLSSRLIFNAQDLKTVVWYGDNVVKSPRLDDRYNNICVYAKVSSKYFYLCRLRLQTTISLEKKCTTGKNASPFNKGAASFDNTVLLMEFPFDNADNTEQVVIVVTPNQHIPIHELRFVFNGPPRQSSNNCEPGWFEFTRNSQAWCLKKVGLSAGEQQRKFNDAKGKLFIANSLYQ